MAPNRTLLAVICAAAVAGTTALTTAFAQQPGTIRVNIDDVSNKIAQNIQAETSQIPRTVLAPVEVAATVCGIPPDVLVKLIDVREGCTATTTSPALEQIVQARVSAK
jgi:hypothetical protein